MPKASEIKIDDFIIEPGEKIGKKCPNSFFVYRRVYTKELLRRNHRLEMAIVSRMASSQWRNENAKVREEYRQVAKMIRERLEVLEHSFPKSLCYKFVPFEQPKPSPNTNEGQQTVLNTKLLSMLHLWYSKSIIDEFLDRLY
ncbi:16512_t:CDS:1 [Acaulospora colombiana]|uniref:16512_t:CDS:1 n=1 Tax=Acaulospora colombiana TaxID=27376 RepID=A0ACA9K8I9_9GLOM|nr:16512_t:CDS:1 [Acaulospora colombiana]